MNNTIVIFVTKGESEKFSEDEIREYFDTRPDVKPFSDAEVPEVIPEVEPFKIRDKLRNMFMKDLRFGIKFCCDKYGTTTDNILSEAKRIAPHMTRFNNDLE